MTRRLALVSLLLLLAAPLRAQQPPDLAGRWRVLLHPLDASQETIRGDLDLRPDSVPAPTLRLETDSSDVAFEVSDIRRPAPESLIVRRDDPDGLELLGRWNGMAYVGTARDRLGSRGTFEANRLPDGAEYYAALPRFRLRQLLLGPRGDAILVPASWWSAALALGAAQPMERWLTRHTEAARAAGVRPADSASTRRWLQGLEDRVHLREAMIQGLLRVRRGATDSVARAMFDGLFRRDSRWVVDIHDAAAEWIRVRQPAWTWEVTGASLAAAGLVPAGADEAGVLSELGTLWALAQRDPAAAETRLAAIRQAAPGDSTLPAVMAGYTTAIAWHLDAVRYLTGRLAPPALMGASIELDAEPRPEGEVEATLALRGPIISACVEQQNPEGRSWMARHGQSGMAAALGRLDPSYGAAGQVEVDGRKLTLSTPAMEASRDAAGLSDVTAIRYDPREPPLFAVSRVIEAASRLAFLTTWRAGAGLHAAGEICFLPDAEPHLLAGFGAVLEGRSAQQADLPVLAAASALRRAEAAQRAPSSPEVVGPFLVEAHARQLKPANPGALLTSLVGLGYDWPRAAAFWPAPPAEAKVQVLAPSRGPVLVPSLDFFIESGLPTATGMRVLPLTPSR